MTAHYRQAFDDHQAKVLAEATVQIEADLVRREDFSKLTATVGRLADAQERTEKQMKQLAAAQQRTEVEIHELFVAQKELTWTMKDVHKQLGGLAQSVGHGLEAYAMERIPRILAEHCGFVTESSVPETIYADDRGNEIDIICRGTIAGRPAAVLCEVKTNITSHEVREFMEVFERVRPQLARDEKLDPANIHPLFFGYRASPDTRRLIADSDAWLAFPRRLVVPGYIAAGGLGGPGAVSLVRASDFDGKGVTREAAIQARSTSNGHARRTREPHPAQRPVAFRISSVRMIATPISDSPAISPLDTGTV